MARQQLDRMIEANEPGAVKQWAHNARLEIAMYLRHVRGLLIPGITVSIVETDTLEPESLDGWGDDALRIVVDEGRRQIDRQSERFDRVRSGAQFLFTTALALLVVLGASAHRVLDQEGVVLRVAWMIGLVAVAGGTLGAAAILTVKAEFGSIHTALLSRSGPDPLRDLAVAYTQQVRAGENTLNARVTVYRDAVWLVLVGALVQLIVWITAVA
jgi:hypothetical protein